MMFFLGKDGLASFSTVNITQSPDPDLVIGVSYRFWTTVFLPDLFQICVLHMSIISFSEQCFLPFSMCFDAMCFICVSLSIPNGVFQLARSLFDWH